jgi:hypothetical protein
VVIYGAGGYNRYSVGDNGLVYPIDESFPNKEKLQLAKQLLSGSKAMKINEIHKIASYTYSGIESLQDANKKHSRNPNFKPLPGKEGLFYLIFSEQFRIEFMIAVANTPGMKNPNVEPTWLIVGYLNAYLDTIDNIYDKRVLQVGVISVDSKFRGRGIASTLYDLLLKGPEKFILFSGSDQTPGGQAMWANLNRKPDIEVTGWVSFYTTEPKSAMNKYNDAEFIKFIEDQGGAYFGESATDKIFFEFAVSQLPTKAQLEILGKRSPVTVYGGRQTGLMARYIE